MATTKDPVRVAVTGAAGQIGYSLLFRIASGSMLGPDQPVILQMLEITPALPGLAGVAMELEDCAFPLLAGMVQTDDPDTAFGDVDAFFRLIETGNLRRLVGAVEAARVHLSNRDTNLAKGNAECLRGRFALVVELALLRDIVLVEGVGVRLIRMSSAMSDDDDVPTGAKRRCKVNVAWPRLPIGRTAQQKGGDCG